MCKKATFFHSFVRPTFKAHCKIFTVHGNCYVNNLLFQNRFFFTKLQKLLQIDTMVKKWQYDEVGLSVGIKLLIRDKQRAMPENDNNNNDS